MGKALVLVHVHVGVAGARVLAHVVQALPTTTLGDVVGRAITHVGGRDLVVVFGKQRGVQTAHASLYFLIKIMPEII